MKIASQELSFLKHAPLVAVREYNGINSLTVELNGEWIAYDLTKEEAFISFQSAVLALTKVGFAVRKEGEDLIK